MKNIYLAHTAPDGREQTIKEHSENTAALCRRFAIPQLKDEMYLMGLLHDIGKYQETFVKRIHGEQVAVEHSICGAKAVYESYGELPTGLMLEYCIAGHHSGLPDGGTKGDGAGMKTLHGRLKRSCGDFSVYESELDVPEADPDNFVKLLLSDCEGSDAQIYDQVIDKFAFFTRYSFSCLVDADSTDTAGFCGNDPGFRSLHADFEACLKRVNEKLGSFDCVTELQRSRKILQEEAFANIKKKAEIYLLDMPTGSGKTLCSIKCALIKAIEEHKKRIIYVIPYNSIIDQTAEIFSEIFGSDGEILRHQSTFSFEDSGKDDDFIYGAKYAAENWDAPIIITTVVQFFESLFSNKRGRLRKMHNMQDAVIVFDEVHLMPVKYLQPCLQAVGYITKYLNSCAVFMTATMPDFSALMDKYVQHGAKTVSLIDDKKEFSKFKKCSYEYIGEISKETLIKETHKYPSNLIVVNTRKTARAVFGGCCGKKYHLSTYMTAVERARVIREINFELKKIEQDFPDLKDVPEERRITVVSTSLIEAGVDMDVYMVFRETSGLDSILQAGGRCNREGKRKDAKVYVFELLKEEARPDPDIKRNLTKGLLEKYDDISAPESIDEYYRRLMSMSEDMITEYAMHKNCRDISCMEFAGYSEWIKIIDTAAVPLVVPLDEKAGSMAEKLKYEKYADIRALQKYTCQIYPYELEELIKQHAVSDYGTGIYCLTNLDYYNPEIGITFEAKDYFI